MTYCGSDGGASLGDDGYTTDESVGGVPVDGLLSLVRALIGCGASPDVAVQSATTLYVNQSCQSPVGSVVSSVGSRAVRSAQRQAKWHASVSGLPYQDGQCYLHPVRWGKRAAYLAALKTNPAFSDFVAMLRPGDLNEQVAKEMSLYRIRSGVSDVVYHVASDYVEGERVASVYDAIAGFLRQYPWVNSCFKLEGPGVETIPFVGTVGRAAVGAQPDLSGIDIDDPAALPSSLEESQGQVVDVEQVQGFSMRRAPVTSRAPGWFMTALREPGFAALLLAGDDGVDPGVGGVASVAVAPDPVQYTGAVDRRAGVGVGPVYARDVDGEVMARLASVVSQVWPSPPLRYDVADSSVVYEHGSAGLAVRSMSAEYLEAVLACDMDVECDVVFMSGVESRELEYRCVEVPVRVRVRLSSGPEVFSVSRAVVMFVPESVTVTVVRPRVSLAQCGVSTGALGRLRAFWTAGVDADFVVRSLGAVDSYELTWPCLPIRNGSKLVPLYDPTRYYTDVDEGYNDCLRVSVLGGRLRAAALEFAVGVRCTFLAKAGHLDVLLSPVTAQATLCLNGVIDLDGDA